MKLVMAWFLIAATCVASDKVHKIEVTYIQNNDIAECTGDPQDLLDFLQIVIVEQRIADNEYWDTKGNDAEDWLHDRHLGMRKMFVKCANNIYDGEPLRVDLRKILGGSEMRSKGFSRAVEKWRHSKSKSYLFGNDEPRALHIKFLIGL